MALQLETDLRTQVRGQRWHGRSQKWQRPGDRSLLEESEVQLLRLYLHVPEYRLLIKTSLEERDLDFNLSHHRLLWQMMLEVETSAPTEAKQDLLSLLQDRCLETEGFGFVQGLMQLDEKTQRDLLRAPLVVRTAIASMERVMCEKRRRHFLDLWKQTDCNATPDLAQYYQQQIYAETQRIAAIDQEQRQVTFEDLAQIPWVGEFRDALGISQ
jgi:DNA primase